jgi:hypothetical protein
MRLRPSALTAVETIPTCRHSQVYFLLSQKLLALTSALWRDRHCDYLLVLSQFGWIFQMYLP